MRAFSKPNEPFNRSLKLVCVCVAILGILLWVGCRRKSKWTHAHTRTKGVLHSIGKGILLLEYTTGQQAPITLSALVTWFVEEECAPCDDRFLDSQAKTFVDFWGRPIVLVVHEGRLVALGSKGPDGEWEGGKGDDVYVDLNEMRKRWESQQPASQPD